MLNAVTNRASSQSRPKSDREKMEHAINLLSEVRQHLIPDIGGQALKYLLDVCLHEAERKLNNDTK